MTSKALEAMGTPYFIVVEEQERDAYATVINPAKILVLDRKYQDDYDTCDDLGYSKSKGPGAARNFAWDHSIAGGHAWHWVMDDNIKSFRRYHHNFKYRMGDGTCFRVMEDFVDRYENVAMAGPTYIAFVARKQDCFPPFILNTRIYSCNLIRNDVPFRWRGRYNEDTDLSLRMLKAGWCTIQFYAFLQEKMATQTVKGGNHEDFYSKEGTYPKSKMQVDLHPDVSKMVMRYGRCHHLVDYTPFKKNVLRRKPDPAPDPSDDPYGLKVVHVKNFQEPENE